MALTRQAGGWPLVKVGLLVNVCQPSFRSVSHMVGTRGPYWQIQHFELGAELAESW